MNPYDPFNKTTFCIKPRSTDVWGIRYFPSLEPDISNDQDYPHFGWITNVEVSEDNISIVKQIVSQLETNLRSIMEIGVKRIGSKSMSSILINDRPKDSFYLGIDIGNSNEFDTDTLNDPDSNTWILKTKSDDQDKIRSFLKDKHIQELDLLFIDGYHSVNMTVNDWKYANLLSKNGIVVLHDSNSHPGCVALYNAVNDELFEKNRYCTENDFGIAVFRKL